MDALELAQGSAEWRAARVGKVTASRVADLMARTRSGYGASRQNYQAELIVERLTGQPTEGFMNDAMRWGTETEPQARAAYSFYRDADVQEVGFIVHPSIEMAGCSPDGLVGADGLVELKCPNTATHIDMLLTGAVPDKYVVQMLFQMACTGRQWCDFCSFDPRLPAHLRLWVKRIPRDDARITDLEGAVMAFLAELDAKVAQLEKLAA